MEKSAQKLGSLALFDFIGNVRTETLLDKRFLTNRR